MTISAANAATQAGEDTKLFQIDLDIAVDDDVKVQDFAGEFNLLAIVINPSGPGGGWPIYRFIGTEANILKYLVKYYDEDQAYFNEFAEDYRIDEGMTPHDFADIVTKLTTEMVGHFKMEVPTFYYDVKSEQAPQMVISLGERQDRKLYANFFNLFIVGGGFRIYEDKSCRRVFFIK